METTSMMSVDTITFVCSNRPSKEKVELLNEVAVYFLNNLMYIIVEGVDNIEDVKVRAYCEAYHRLSSILSCKSRLYGERSYIRRKLPLEVLINELAPEGRCFVMINVKDKTIEKWKENR